MKKISLGILSTFVLVLLSGCGKQLTAEEQFLVECYDTLENFRTYKRQIARDDVERDGSMQKERDYLRENKICGNIDDEILAECKLSGTSTYDENLTCSIEKYQERRAEIGNK